MSEQEEMDRLIARIRNADHATALAAIDELKERGDIWFGKLRGANLSGAKLHGVNLTSFEGHTAFLKGVNLTGADLSEAVLDRVCFAEANLQGVDLSHASLREADFEKAFLDGAIIYNADLSEADFRNSSLRQTILSGSTMVKAVLRNNVLLWTDLDSVDLCKSLLDRVKFIETRLNDANLGHAQCLHSSFSGVDLSEVIGLDTIIHLGPSDVSLDTIQMSKGNLPRVFLRGCGIPEEIVAYLLTNPSTKDFYSCFISYSHTDQTFARLLHDTLENRGIRCWLDEHQLLPGDPIHDEIDRGIRIWDKVLFCCSRESMKSWWVKEEFNRANLKEYDLSKRHGKPINVFIPIDLDGYIFSDECDNAVARKMKSDYYVANFQGWDRDSTVI